MRRILLVSVFLLATAAGALAQPSLPAHFQSLADVSSLVVTGRVAGTTVQADAGFIYTYVTVDVADVLKGQPGQRTIVVKQLGGTLPTLGLYIADQARFRTGEEVLLFLTVRPRDGTLQTARLADGKWTLLPNLQTGGRTAVWGDVQVDFDGVVRPFVAASAPVARPFVAMPQEFGQSATPAFTTIPPSEGGPARWHQADDRESVRIDYQTGTDTARLNAAKDRWNAVNTTLQFALGAAAAPPASNCSGFVDSRTVRFFWNDPCQEYEDNDPTFFGVGGGFFTPGFQKTVNGVTFNAFVQGLAILNNVGPHTENNACMEDAIGHLLGHALGLGHSASTAALMYPTLRASCSGGSTGLGTDDVDGIRFIYPGIPSGGTPPHAPTALTNTVTLDSVLLQWTPAPTGGPPQRYIVTARSSSDGPVIATLTVNSTTPATQVLAVPLGTYYVRVQAQNNLGTSLPSPETVVTVGPCEAPPPPTNLAYTTADNLVTITWTAPASGITEGYRLYAGFSEGQSNALVMDLGNTTAFAGTAPFGNYYVRVAAGNRCSLGAPSTPDLLVQVQPCTTRPAAPTGLTYSVSPSRVVTLSWTAPTTGDLPSRYQIQAGSQPGLSNLLVQTTPTNATSFVATAPAGTYHVRVAGVNQCGVGETPSNEVVITVP